MERIDPLQAQTMAADAWPACLLDLILAPGAAAEAQPLRGALIVDAPDAWSARLLQPLRQAFAGAQLPVVQERWVPALQLPYGAFRGLLDQLAVLLAEADPAVLRRYGRTLVSLLPHLRSGDRSLAPLRDLLPYRAGLADYVFGRNEYGLRDFYEGRRRDTQLIADIVHCILAGAQALGTPQRPLVLILERADLADEQSLQVFNLLARYAAQSSLVIVTTLGCRAAETAPALAELAELPGWRTLQAQSLAVEQPAPPEAEAPASAEQQRELHRRALAALDSDCDPFLAAFHAQAAGLADHQRHALRAMEIAWVSSAYDSAIAYARQALTGGRAAPGIDSDLLLGLLHYEAHRFSEVDGYLLRVLERAGDQEQQVLLHRLLGYSYVFGVRDFAKGYQHLSQALRHYEAEGRTRDSAWVRNSIAFVLYNQQRRDEARQVEELALSEAQALERADRFLLTILQLNLGRLQRAEDVQAAIERIRRSMADGRGELGPYFLLLLYATLADMLVTAGDPQGAIGYYELCLRSIGDFDAAGPPGRVLPILSRMLPGEVRAALPNLALGNDVVLFLLYFNLGLLYHRLGRQELAESYRAWLVEQLRRWGRERLISSIMSAWSGTSVPAVTERAPAGRDLREALQRYGDDLLLEPLEQPVERAAERLAEGLAEGLSIAWLRPRSAGPGGATVESLVLHDARNAALHSAICHGLRRDIACGEVLLLPEAAALFLGLATGFPLVLQEATLAPEQRARFHAISPIQVKARILDERAGELYTLLRSYAERTGVPLLLALTMRSVGEEIADTPEQALKYYLESCIDILICDELEVSKRHGAASDSNLLRLCPRLSGTVGFSRAVAETAGQVLVATPTRSLRISGAGYAILQRCDGSANMRELAAALAQDQPDTQQICGFLRQMRHYGVIHFV